LSSPYPYLLLIIISYQLGFGPRVKREVKMDISLGHEAYPIPVFTTPPPPLPPSPQLPSSSPSSSSSSSSSPRTRRSLRLTNLAVEAEEEEEDYHGSFSPAFNQDEEEEEDGIGYPVFAYTTTLLIGDDDTPTDTNGKKGHHGCNCQGKCKEDQQKCGCVKRNSGYPYREPGGALHLELVRKEEEEEGPSTPDFLILTLTLTLTLMGLWQTKVYGCGPHCSCDEGCDMKKGSRSLGVPVMIYWTQEKGFGVHTR